MQKSGKSSVCEFSSTVKSRKFGIVKLKCYTVPVWVPFNPEFITKIYLRELKDIQSDLLNPPPLVPWQFWAD